MDIGKSINYLRMGVVYSDVWNLIIPLVSDTLNELVDNSLGFPIGNSINSVETWK